MALPVSPAPKSDDVVVHGWSGITVRIAWTLLARGVKVRPQVLRDARHHVMLHLEPHVPLTHAEDLAAALTEAFVERARGRQVSDPWPQDMRMPLSPRWRRALDRSSTQLAEVLFRKHYGDNRGLEQLERKLKVDRVALEAARGGLREVVRRAAATDGVPIDQWPGERIDRLLVRLAAFAPGPCPPLLDVVEGGFREHTATCIRCDRTVRLLRSSILTVEDLIAPSVGARPSGTAHVLALHLHPDGRHHRRALRDELLAEGGIELFPVGEDLLFVDASGPERIHEVLRIAAELGCPHRDHVRAALLVGPGAWTRHGLVGPLVERAEHEVRHRTWGLVDGFGELPPPLPPPPSARPWWMFAASLAIGCAMVGGMALRPVEVSARDTLTVDFTAGRGGVWAAFDLPEEACLGVVREVQGRLEVVHASARPTDKVVYALGDGGYRLHTEGEALLIVSSARPVDVEGLARRASEAPDPLERLAELVRDADPSADLGLHRR